MSNNQIPIPSSGRRYYVSEIGEIFNNTGTLIKPIKKDGELYVELDWVLGRRYYKCSILVLITYKLISIPDHLLDEIITLYRDDSKTNVTPQNLLYKFKNGRLQVEDYPGFFYIPFYNDYAINENGDLININTGKFKSWSITKPSPDKNQTGGYRYSRVLNNLGFSKILFQHRALCLVFKDYSSNIEKLVVNHIDGKPQNNKLDNLELVTYQRNNIHAVEIGLRGDNKPVFSKNLLTGEIIKFESVSGCNRYYTGSNVGFVSHRLNNCYGKVYSDMLLFKYDDNTEWPDINLETVKIDRTGRPEDISARNVFTGDVILFTGAPSGFNLTGVKAATILSHIKENKVIPVNGWNFRYFNDNIEWPKHNERNLRIYSKFPIYPPDGVIVTVVETGEEIFFESVALMNQYFRINKTVFYYYENTKKLFLNKYRFDLYRLRENLGHPTEQSVEK